MSSLSLPPSRGSIRLFICALLLSCSGICRAAPGPSPASPLDQHTLDKRAKPALKAVHLDAADSPKAERVKAIVEEHLQAVQAWHQQHHEELAELWSAWSRARSTGNKDEAAAEKVGEQIDALYATFAPSHEAFLSALAKELSPAEIETVKDAMTAKPGLKRTYDAYLEMVPALKESEKQDIHRLLETAREQSLDATDDGKGAEKVNLFKKQKVKVQAYLDAHGYDYEKSYKAWVERLKAKSAGAKTPAS